MTYSEAYANTESAFALLGTTPEQATEHLLETTRIIGAFAATAQHRALSQAVHDLTINRPQDPARDWPPTHAVLNGIVSAIGQLLDWNILAARDLAARILEDVNDHEKAAVVFGWAREGER